MKIKQFVAAIGCMLCLNSNAQNILFTHNSNWNYKDDGSNQGTTWKNTAFDDALWLSGNGQFGYGEGDETTLLNACGTVVANPSCTNKYITSYFRKTININDINLYQSFTFNMFRDDGVVIYINGNEVQRNNMPTGTISSTTLASAAASDDGQNIINFSLNQASSFLTTGINVIAVELHQSAANSSDLTFSMELIGNYVGSNAIITRGPYLQMVNSAGITLRWRTDIASDSKVKFGTDAANLSDSVIIAGLTTEHTVQLNGLQPYTKYFYGIGSSATIIQAGFDNYFLTSPNSGTSGKYRFWVTGDCGTGYAEQLQVLNQYNNFTGNTPTNGWLLLGDNAYNGGFDNEYSTNFFAPYQSSIMKKAPLWPAPGNHDYDNNGTKQNTHAVPYYDIFNLPSQAECGGVASNTEAFYSYDYGNIHFLALDSYGKENNATRLYDTTGAQVQWIKNDLAANNKPWVIAYWHHPPYTMGSHNSDTENDLVSIRSNFVRVLERLGVDLVMCGHSHAYERTKLMKEHYGLEPTFNANVNNLSNSTGKYDGSTNSCAYLKDSLHNSLKGAVYVVSGSAGKFGGTSAGYPHNAMEYSNVSNPGSVILDFDDNRLDVKWLCGDGVMRDQFTIVKNASKVRNYTINEGDSILLNASWNGQYLWNNTSEQTKQIYAKPVVSSSIIVTDQYQCIADTFNIIVLPLLADFNVADTIVCAGATVSFTNNSTSNAETFLWSFIGGTPAGSTLSNPVITYETPGIYPVSLTVYHANATNTKTINGLITVNPLIQPQITITSDTASICAGGNINFNAQIINGGNLPNYQWKVDGFNVGTNGSTYSSNTLQNGQLVSCAVSYNENCVSLDTVLSNSINISVTPVSVPSVSINQTQGNNPACFGDNLSFTALTSNAGLNPVYQWKLNGNNVGINSSIYNSASLSNGQNISCEIISSAACASPMNASSNEINLIVNQCNNVPITQLRAADCGKQNLALNGAIACNAVAGATNYDFEFTNLTTNVVGIKTVTSTSVSLSSVSPAMQFGTQYNVRVRAKVGGVYGNYGNVCVIGTVCNPTICGVPLTQLRSTDCGKLNLSPLTGLVIADAVVAASHYEFEIRNISTNAIYATKLQTSNALVINTVAPALQWNTQYNVKVRAYIGGIAGTYGNNCVIGFIPDPAVSGVPNTQLNTAVCGKLNLALTGSITCTPVTGAGSYEWEFKNQANTTVVATKTTTSTSLNLSTVAGLQWNTQYNVRVRAFIGTVAGTFNVSCLIGLIPDPAINGVPSTKIRTNDCGKLNFGLGGFVVADPVSGAVEYEFEIRDNITNAFIANKIQTSNGLTFSTVPAFTWGMQYKISVRARISTIWGTFGTQCTIGFICDPNVCGVPTTALRSTDCGKLNLNFSTGLVVATTVNGATLYEFEITDLTTNAVSVQSRTTVNLVINTVVPALQNNRQYSIRVRATISGVVGNYGNACTIGFVSGSREDEATTISEVIGSENNFKLMAFPNPFNENITLYIQSNNNETVTIDIFDLTGKLVFNQQVNTNENILIGNDFANGEYIIRTSLANGLEHFERIIKVK